MNTMSNSSTARPDATWTLDRLEKYALSRMKEISNFGRKTLEQTWLFGESLSYIRQIKKEGKGWMEWLKTQRFSPSTASNAIKLYERISYEDLESCEGMNVTDLKVALDIIKQPPVKKRQRPTPTGSERMASDHKLAKATPLSIFDGGNRDDEQPAIVTPVEAPVVSAAPHQDTPEHAASAKTEMPAQKITPVTALEYLHRINMKLEELERDLEGVQPDEHLLTQIDTAIRSLQRLRGDAATETDAA